MHKTASSASSARVVCAPDSSREPAMRNGAPGEEKEARRDRCRYAGLFPFFLCVSTFFSFFFLRTFVCAAVPGRRFISDRSHSGHAVGYFLSFGDRRAYNDHGLLFSTRLLPTAPLLWQRPRFVSFWRTRVSVDVETEGVIWQKDRGYYISARKVP